MLDDYGLYIVREMEKDDLIVIVLMKNFVVMIVNLSCYIKVLYVVKYMIIINL